MLLIILLVLWTMVMFLWLLAMLGAIPNTAAFSPWLAWFSVLFLGLVVFVANWQGVVVR